MSQYLRQRADILRAVRAYFDQRDYLEVETPARVRSPGQEVHIDAFPAGDDRFLITSPEYHMKRLVAAGHARIYQIARCFRAEEAGHQHQPEFTMLEWYCAGAALEHAADDCEALLAIAAGAVGKSPPAPATRTTVAKLMREHAGVDLRGDETAAELREKIARAGHQTGPAASPALSWDALFFQLFVDRVEPALSASQNPTLVFDWPVPLAALARRNPANPAVAERFELYAGGLELANAYGELTDPTEQRQRFVDENQRRLALGKRVYPLDESLLNALGSMPPTAGVALGLDRLVMFATGATDIREVIAFADKDV